MIRTWKNLGKRQQMRLVLELQKRHATVATAKPDDSGKPKESQSFVLNAFCGLLQNSQVFPYPDATTPEQKGFTAEISESLHKFYKEVNNADKNDRLSRVEPATVEALWEMGAFGMQVPAEHGGLELNNSQYAAAAEITGQYDLAVGIFIGAHQSIGYKGILLFGTPEQKSKYLPRVTTGKDVAAFVLTEPASGSDAASIRTRAELSPDGKHYILNGSKIWISNGSFAEIMTVFAKTLVKDKVTGVEKDKVTAFIVERAFGGVSSGPPEDKMGIKASNTAEVYFDNTKVPVENVIGGVGNGFKVAMGILNNGRFGMAASMAGVQITCIKKSVEFATQRKQFGRTIDNYGSIQEKIGRMNTLHYVTQSLAFLLAANMDKGSKEYHIESAVAKVFGSEAAWWVCDEAIQVMGGMGFMRSTGLERFTRDLRIFRIFEGANDILRLFIALNGVQHAGQSLKELQQAFKNPAANLGLVFAEAQKRAVRSIGLGQVPSMTHEVHPNLTVASHQCAKSVHLLGTVAEKLLMKHGKNIVEQQFILGRIGNIAIDCYTMAVVLSRCTDSLQRGLPSAAHEENMTKLWCFEASERVSKSSTDVLKQTTLDSYGLLSEISRAACQNGGVFVKNPMGISG